MAMKKRIIILVVVLAVSAAAYYVLRGRNSQPSDRIRVSGNIELTEVDVGFKVAGKLVERTVNEGDRVEKGAVVARLDREQLLRQREQAQAALELAQAQLAQSETGVKWQRESLAADLEQRKADLGAQQARLTELKNGARPEELRETRAVVAAAEAEAERARKDWERAQVLYKDDDISTQQYDQARSRNDAASASLKQARERLALVTAGPRSEVIEAAASQVERARASLRLGEANTLEVRRREQEILARRAEIDRAKAQIALIDTQLEDTIAYAPSGGVVLVKAADPGEVLAPGTTVLTIGDLEKPWLRAYVNERDLGRVKLGSKARVATDSYPGRTYNGTVTFVASEAEFTPKQIQTTEERVKLVYRVKISLDNPKHELKANMPADGEILLEQ
jgi:HlyD family secretion protein